MSDEIRKDLAQRDLVTAFRDRAGSLLEKLRTIEGERLARERREVAR
jgi:hypothetical protein